MPDRTFRDSLTIGRGQDRIDLYYFGRGHTNGDAIVVFPAVRAMHTGDLFAWPSAPLIDRDNGGSGVEYATTLEKAVKGVANVDTVIPGHADVTTWAAFAEFAAFNRELVTVAESARRAGKSADAAAAELKLPARFADYIADRPMAGLEFIGTNLARARANVVAIFNELAGSR
jgi:glyoxylase-like metal-dependent hydrolase (beta-lactamase superfamily II)